MPLTPWTSLETLPALAAVPAVWQELTGDHFDAISLSLLHQARAAFYPIDANVILTRQGTIHSRQQPGILFTAFAPQPKDVDEEAARSAFAIVNALDSERPLTAPTILTVFRLYCVEERSAADIARACACSKATVVGRLNLIHKKTGAQSVRSAKTLRPPQHNRGRVLRPPRLSHPPEEPHRR